MTQASRTRPVARSLSRRRFLRTSARAAAAVPAFSGLLLTAAGAGRDAVRPNAKVRVGLIGAGGMGRGDLATFLLNPEVDCPIVCDVDDAQAAQASRLVQDQRGHAPDTAKDFRRVLERKDVDVVLIATPDHWHALPTVLACQAHKDVYVEKPLATSIAEGRAMVDAARQHRRIVQMGTQWRSGAHWKDAVEFVQSGKLGAVSLVRGWAFHDWISPMPVAKDGPVPAGVDYDLWLGPAPQRPFNPNRFHFNFRWFWDYAGGLMTDWGVHLINIMLWAMGPTPPRSILSSGGNFDRSSAWETPDAQTTVYEFPSYTLIWEHRNGIGIGLNSRPWGISFTGSLGTLFLNDAGWEIVGERRPAALEPQKAPGSGDPRPAHVRNFLDAVRSRRPPVEPPEFAHFVSTVAHLGNIAFRTGRKVTWDAARERVSGDPEADRLTTVAYRKPWALPGLREMSEP